MTFPLYDMVCDEATTILYIDASAISSVEEGNNEAMHFKVLFFLTGYSVRRLPRLQLSEEATV